jgi:hypothetical protein
MYVEKILRNQKRMERTIQLYEENQKKENPEGAKDPEPNDGGSPVVVTGATMQIRMTIEPEPEPDYYMSEVEAVA